jgi:ribosome biogenesis GTPase / thiamine phosphate phosphatase
MKRAKLARMPFPTGSLRHFPDKTEKLSSAKRLAPSWRFWYQRLNLFFRKVIHERDTVSGSGSVTERADAAFLASHGWSSFFSSQIERSEAGLLTMRIAEVHRARLGALSAEGPVKLVLPHKTNTADFAVGDWILADPRTHLLVRRLERRTLLQRRTEGRHLQQLAAANVDTLFIVTSCNADFSPARLERYLAMANQAGTNPVIVLTKTDMIDDASIFEQQARALQRDLDVVALNGRSADAAAALAAWCGEGQTVALVGSSGVGKSTLVNTLAGLRHEAAQETGDIRESDAKGRHTTTAPLLARHCRRRLGDRHAGNAHPACQRRVRRHRDAVLRNHRPCPVLQVSRLHP